MLLKPSPFLQQNSIDLLFLDIKMPDIPGIDYKCLQQVPIVVFSTASEYAVKGFELNAVEYLLEVIRWSDLRNLATKRWK